MCIFCLESQTPQIANSFLGPSWPYVGRVIVSNDFMYAVPGYGPQVFPYILVISKRHFDSLARSTYQERRAIIDVLERLRAMPMFVTGKLCVFEHGGCISDTHSCIDHFHFHVIDASIDLASHVCAEYNYELITIGSRCVFTATSRYLFVGNYSGIDEIQGVLARSTDIESQYFRRKLAALTGQQTWDWRIGMNPDLMLRVMQESEGF